METRSNVCNVDGCSEPVHVTKPRDPSTPPLARSCCVKHFRQQWLEARERRRVRDEQLSPLERKCSTDGCDLPREPGEAHCDPHLRRQRRNRKAALRAREALIPVADRPRCVEEDCSEPRYPGDPRCREHMRERSLAKDRARRARLKAAKQETSAEVSS